MWEAGTPNPCRRCVNAHIEAKFQYWPTSLSFRFRYWFLNDSSPTLVSTSRLMKQSWSTIYGTLWKFVSANLVGNWWRYGQIYAALWKFECLNLGPLNPWPHTHHFCKPLNNFFASCINVGLNVHWSVSSSMQNCQCYSWWHKIPFAIRPSSPNCHQQSNASPTSWRRRNRNEMSWRIFATKVIGTSSNWKLQEQQTT